MSSSAHLISANMFSGLPSPTSDCAQVYLQDNRFLTSLVWPQSLHLSDMGNLTSSWTTIDIALGVIGALKHLYYLKMETQQRRQQKTITAHFCNYNPLYGTTQQRNRRQSLHISAPITLCMEQHSRHTASNISYTKFWQQERGDLPTCSSYQQQYMHGADKITIPETTGCAAGRTVI